MADSQPKERAKSRVTLASSVSYTRQLTMATVRGFLRHNGFTTSAALAYYFLMSLLPFFIFLASALALLPIRHLAARMIQLASHFVPSSTMPMIESMLNSSMQSSQSLLSAGFILAMITASNAFAEMSSVLDAVYEVPEMRGFWRNRLTAIGTTFVVGGMTIVALSAMLLGPHFGRELERVFGVSHTFTIVWPTLRWVLAVTCALASIEVLYFMGVSRKHSLRQQLPGSVFAVAVWIASSGVMGVYFRQFSYMNAMYGALASVIILAVWLQLTAIAILLGAELNVDMEKRKHEAVPEKPVREDAEVLGQRREAKTTVR
jgi:membrane protein